MSIAFFAKNHRALLRNAALKMDPNSGKWFPLSKPVLASVKRVKPTLILSGQRLIQEEWGPCTPGI